jgi:sulfur-oxidizing protein SoxZ
MMLSRIQMPLTAKRGEIMEIRIAMQHPMETGYRHDDMGRAIPANVINKLSVTYDGKEIFRAGMGTAISANPYLGFFTIVGNSGAVEFSWVDDKGETGSARVPLTVS